MNGLLLDTHVLLWWLADDPRLPKEIRTRIADPDSLIFVSAASIWEIGIKRAIGKLEAPAELVAVIHEEGFLGLPIELLHAETASLLPPHHRDPFDRMLIAQSMLEQMTVVTADRRFESYGIKLMRV